MDMWKFFDITHRHHRFCNPISVEKLDELCALAGLSAGASVLDIACGKAELLVRLAGRYEIKGVGVDLSPYCIHDAEEKRHRLAPGADLEFFCLRLVRLTCDIYRIFRKLRKRSMMTFRS
jgi:ubiquinone/menaquinone biosynthesis C-methylase UbiE